MIKLTKEQSEKYPKLQGILDRSSEGLSGDEIQYVADIINSSCDVTKKEYFNFHFKLFKSIAKLDNTINFYNLVKRTLKKFHGF